MVSAPGPSWVQSGPDYLFRILSVMRLVWTIYFLIYLISGCITKRSLFLTLEGTCKSLNSFITCFTLCLTMIVLFTPAEYPQLLLPPNT